jgi:tetratricopeptide (TPR) repeat protein
LVTGGRGYEQAKQWAKAIPVLTRLIQAYPENSEYHLHRGRAYIETNRLPEALADFRYHPIPALPPGNLPKSQAGQLAADILFYNNTASAIKLYWINFDGKPVAYGTIPPKAIFPEAGTFVSHVWLITDTDDKPIAGYVVPPMGGLALIESK